MKRIIILHTKRSMFSFQALRSQVTEPEEDSTRRLGKLHPFCEQGKADITKYSLSKIVLALS